MKVLEKYTGEKTYLFPNGHLGTKEAVLNSFPAALDFVHVVTTDESGEVMQGFDNLATLKSIHNIDRSLSEEEAIAKIQEIINTPEPEPEVDTTPSAEERIAAALEYQNLASMEDTTETA